MRNASEEVRCDGVGGADHEWLGWHVSCSSQKRLVGTFVDNVVNEMDTTLARDSFTRNRASYNAAISDVV